MTQVVPRPRPPWVAAWLVERFASAEQSESILGDLQEEFCEIVSKSSAATAYGWYWRQSLKTIAHLARIGFRHAPWSLAGIVLMGFLLKWFIARLPEQVIIAILRAQRPYSNLHYNLYVWLVTWGIPIARVAVMILTGCIVAVLAKGKEIVATVLLVSISSVVFGLNFFLHTLDRPPWIPMPWFFVLQAFENWMGILAGGILVRIIRSGFLRQYLTPSFRR